MKNLFNWTLFEELPVIGILRGYSVEQVKKIVQYSGKGGLKNIEITMNSKNASDQIMEAKEVARDTMNVGAGTVCTLKDLDSALSAGATFIVTPIVNPDVIQACKKENVPVIPGGFSPTEIYNAWQLGADMVKVFPANRFGPGYIKDIKGPLSDIKLVVTGGVNLDNFQDYIDYGSYGFGVGSPLFNKERVEAGDWGWVQQQARLFAEIYDKQTLGRKKIT